MAEGWRWLDQAGDDLRAAERLAVDPDLAPRIACFLAHLAAEKALKAILIADGTAPRKTHDLLDLAKRLPAPVMTRVPGDDLDLLNVWATQGRYPADLDEATRSEAIECHAAAARLIALMSAWLRTRPD